MATPTYMTGRKKYGRPQAILFSDNPGTLTLDINNKPIWTPIGMEANALGSTPSSDSFLILSDHNRQAIDFKPTRIEKRERMINGRMRSYHIADKLTISTSWSTLPSRSFALAPEFNPSTGKYEAFQHISKRIRRKYDIEELAKELPVELNIFDIIQLGEDELIDKPFTERLKLLESVVEEKERVVRLAKGIIVNNEEEAQPFYQEALDAGNEGVLIKDLIF